MVQALFGCVGVCVGRAVSGIWACQSLSAEATVAGAINPNNSAGAGGNNLGDRPEGLYWASYRHVGRWAAVWGVPKGSFESGWWSVCSQARLAGKNDNQADGLRRTFARNS